MKVFIGLLALAELPLISITWERIIESHTTNYNSEIAIKVRVIMNII